MNTYNLKRMYNHMRTVPADKILMKTWREKEKHIHECNTCGCVIGHCVILDEWENVPKICNREINFEIWSEKFTNIDSSSDTWIFMFGGGWPNDKSQILARMRYVIENNQPPQEWIFRPLNISSYIYKITDSQYLNEEEYAF